MCIHKMWPPWIGTLVELITFGECLALIKFILHQANASWKLNLKNKGTRHQVAITASCIITLVPVCLLGFIYCESDIENLLSTH